MKKMRNKKIVVSFLMLVLMVVSILEFFPKDKIFASSGLSIKKHWERDNDSKDYISYYEISANGPVDNLVILSPADDGKFKATILFLHKVNENTLSRGISGYITYNSLHWNYGTDITVTNDFGLPADSFSESDIGKYKGLLTSSLADTFYRSDFSGWNVTFDSLVDINNAISDGSFTFDKVNVDPDVGFSLDIGALKNVSRNKLFPNGSGNVDSYFWRFRFASKTTTGYDLKFAGTKIRVYESMSYFKRSDNSLYSEGNKIFVGEFDSSSLQFDFDVNQGFKKVTSDTESEYNVSSWDVVAKQLVRDDRIYLQVVSPSGNYGPYLLIDGGNDSSDEHPQSVVDEDGNIISDEDGGYTKDDTDGEIGSSDDGDLDSADDDANNKPSSGNNDVSFDGAVNTATGLLNMIGNVPKALAKLFSFLPDWCLNLLALAFLVIVILIVYKLARG